MANLQLAQAAQEVLNAYNRHVKIFEDMTFAGCSANVKNWNDTLCDLYYSQNLDIVPFLQQVIRTNTPPPPAPAPAKPSSSAAINTNPAASGSSYTETLAAALANWNLTYASSGVDLGTAGTQTKIPTVADPTVVSNFVLPPTPLAEGQYELLSPISSFLFGEGNTGVRVEEADWGSADQRNDDSENPMRDGVRQGRDFFNGRTVTFTINVKPRKGMASALDLVDEMAAAWSGDDIRTVANGYYILRNRRGGRVRRVYGRPRKFAAVSKLSTKGWVPVTCTFDCISHHFYGDQLNSVTAQIPHTTTAPSRTRWPIRWPLRYVEPETSNVSVMRIRGSRAAWPVVNIKAPNGLIDPVLSFGDLGQVPIRGSIPAGLSMIIDSRPWSEGVSLSDGSWVPGMLINCPPLHRWGLPRGDHVLSLAGVDPTRAASVEVQWYETYANF